MSRGNLDPFECVVSDRTRYAEVCEAFGTDVLAEEQAILSVGREFLPAEALAVLDGGEPTAEYWGWLAEQTRAAQREHDADVAAGYESTTG